MSLPLPEFDDVPDAAARIAPYTVRMPVPQAHPLDMPINWRSFFIAPIGGTAIVIAALASEYRSFVADTARLPAADGRRFPGFIPDTVRDGFRDAAGEPSVRLSRHYRARAIVADAAAAIDAMRRTRWVPGRLAELSSAVASTAAAARPERFSGQCVSIALADGHVDLDAPLWVS
jgi:hypothetical protein